MNKLLVFLIIVATCFCSRASAQIVSPVKWSYAAKKTNKTEAIMYLKATIDKGWHIYSQHIKSGGPVKTTISFDKNKGYNLLGTVTEPKPITMREETFNMDVSYFENTVIFQQKIKLKAKTAKLTGKVEYMVCNDRQCLPPSEVAFTVLVK